jgi:CheY-like chemotaxis protein
MDAVEQEKKDREDMDLLRGLETVLVVEDQDVVRELAVDLLSDLGYTVMEAKDGMVALDLCRSYRGKVHVLLTDVIMPKLGGRELAARVRELHPETRVLYMSGYEDGMIAHHGVLEEGIDLMSKPFTEASLAKDIRKVLDR